MGFPEPGIQCTAEECYALYAELLENGSNLPIDLKKNIVEAIDEYENEVKRGQRTQLEKLKAQ